MVKSVTARRVINILKIVGIILGMLLLCVIIYFIYVFGVYYRIGDNATLETSGICENGSVSVETEYKLTTYNLGFGAHSSDFSFFMDGGKYSRAFDKEAVIANTNGCLDTVKQISPDFLFLQEVDTDSTRSYGVDMTAICDEKLSDYTRTYAQNYDSPYLLYPFDSPIGKSKSGIMVYSRYRITSSLRRSLPVEDGLTKILDLDRCYSVNRIACENGRELVLYNLHLSAYTKDGKITAEQIKILVADMKSEYENGNYVICGGDFNKDLLGDSAKLYGIENPDLNWTQPFPNELLPDCMTIVASDETPSCRNIEAPYEKGKTFVVTIDGFIVSDNVTIRSVSVSDNGFEFSDHQAVTMTFVLEALAD